MYQDSDHISDDEIKYGYFSDKDGQTSSSVAMEEDISRRDLDLSDFSDGIIDEEAEKKRRNELRSFVEDEQKNFVREMAKINSLEIEKGKHIQAQIVRMLYNN